MKKIFFLLLLIYGQLFGLDRGSTLKMYHHIFTSLIDKEKISIYTTDQEYIDVFHYSDIFILENEIDKANIILVSNDKMMKEIENSLKAEKKETIVFATDYHLLKKYKNIVGAFYWKKGRSQLLFIDERLKKYKLKLPSEYHKFIVDTL